MNKIRGITKQNEPYYEVHFDDRIEFRTLEGQLVKVSRIIEAIE